MVLASPELRVLVTAYMCEVQERERRRAHAAGRPLYQLLSLTFFSFLFFSFFSSFTLDPRPYSRPPLSGTPKFSVIPLFSQCLSVSPVSFFFFFLFFFLSILPSRHKSIGQSVIDGRPAASQT